MEQLAWDCRRDLARVIVAAALLRVRATAAGGAREGAAVAAVLDSAATGGRLRLPDDVDRTMLSRGCVGADGKGPSRSTFASIARDAVDRANTIVQRCAATPGVPVMPSGTFVGIVTGWQNARDLLLGELLPGLAKAPDKDPMAALAAALSVPVTADDAPQDPLGWFAPTEPDAVQRLDQLREACRAKVEALVRMRETGCAKHGTTRKAVQHLREYVADLPEGRVRQIVAENDGRTRIPVPLLAMAAALTSDHADRRAWVEAVFADAGVPELLATNAAWVRTRGDPSREGALFVPRGFGQLHQRSDPAVVDFVTRAVPERQEARRRLARCFESDVEWMVGCHVALRVIGAMPQGSVLTRGDLVLLPLVRDGTVGKLVTDSFMESGKAPAWLWATATRAPE